MRKPIMMNLSEEELVLLVGIIGYSSGGVLNEVYADLVSSLSTEQLNKADKISTAIAVKANGYHIKEEDLLHEVFKRKG